MQKFRKYSFNIRGRLVEMNRPWIWGILNVTPDSFYSGSRFQTEDSIAQRVREMLAEGADVIDVGGCSTRPASSPVEEDGEMERLSMALPVIRSVAGADALVSVDTFRAGVARKCIEDYGANIVNDVSGGTEEMFDVVKHFNVPYVLTHNTAVAEGADAASEVLRWLAAGIDSLHQMGVCDVIADPGFGFCKNLEQNFAIMRHLEVFHSLGVPLLVGVSRKRMVYEKLGCDAAKALNGSTVLHTYALSKGAQMLRVHDVKEAKEAAELLSQLI